MHLLSLWWWYLAQNTRCAPRKRRYSWPAANMAAVGARKYTQMAVQTPAGSAEPTVRAGSMQMPESGASMLMKPATRKPATQGVKRAVRGEFATFRTIATRRNEMANSAANATQGPRGPGRVAT